MNPGNYRDSAGLAQRAGYKSRSRASEDDGEPDVERHPSAVERGKAAHFDVPPDTQYWSSEGSVAQ